MGHDLADSPTRAIAVGVADRPSPSPSAGGRGPGPGPGGHVRALDGLRGVAIVMVLIFHQTVMHPATAIDHAYLRVTHQFGAGVDLFFVLSGFLITGILHDAKGGAYYFRNFYARRMLRIFPLYYAVLVVALLIVPQISHPKLAKWGGSGGLGGPWYWAFLSNWLIGARGFRNGLLDVTWSLAIEEQFYLLWPLVVWWCGRRALMAICVGLIVASYCCRLGLLTATGAYPMGFYAFTPARMDPLAVGAMIALMARSGRGMAGLVPGAGRVAVAAGLALVALVAAGDRREDGLAGLALYAAVGTAYAAFFGALLVLAVGSGPRSPLVRVLESRPLVVFGSYSYALYLFHYPILGVVRDVFYGPSRFPTLWGSPLPGQVAFSVLATVPALALSWASWHLYEKRFLELKRYFPAGSPAAVGAATTGPPARPSWGPGRQPEASHRP